MVSYVSRGKGEHIYGEVLMNCGLTINICTLLFTFQCLHIFQPSLTQERVRRDSTHVKQASASSWVTFVTERETVMITAMKIIVVCNKLLLSLLRHLFPNCVLVQYLFEGPKKVYQMHEKKKQRIMHILCQFLLYDHIASDARNFEKESIS